MRCPKCQYISFDDSNRCRNCGYDFSFVEPEPQVDLPIRQRDEPAGPMVDIGLASSDPVSPPAPRPSDTPRAAPRRSLTPNGLDLPLFHDGRDDAPLITPPAVPRVPLSVRRAAPAIARTRTDDMRGDEPALEFSDGAAEPRRRREASPTSEAPAIAPAPDTDVAPPFLRLLAATVDALILGGIDAAVLHYTLQMLGLKFADFRALPPVPMGAFLLMLNGGYLTMFTAAGGQTIGKMLTGIRVVPATFPNSVPRVGFATAVIRAAATLLSLAPAGAGFLMGLLRRDGRTLHDKLADTRVIRA